MSIYIGDKEIKNLYIGESTSVSDMQGPAPDGFHVPLSSEWQAIYDAGVSLGAWTSSQGKNLSTYLKLPMAGCRSYDKTVYDINNFGRYWSSSPYSSDTNNANCLYFYSEDIRPQYNERRSYGLYVRCIKNSPTIPTSSWTQLYGTSTGRGIFWNSTDGLISISSNGRTWYTIMDKNLGATTVYNYGNNLTNGNCGNVFQRGNNYGFPGTLNSDSITTSTTQVNVSNYGPGNYYNSSTWINYRPSWCNPANNNLRGGVSQGTTEKSNVKAVYLGDTKVRPSVHSVSISFSYTGGDQTWTVPYTQDYIITCKGAGSNTSAGGLGQGTITLTKGTVLKIMVGQSGSSTSSGTYGFGGTSNYSSNRSGGGLSGVFTGSETITATSSARALVIGGGAGGGTSGRAGGVGGGTTGATGGGSNYGTAGGGGTQTGRGSGGNAGSEQFRGGNGSGTYGWGGGGGRWGGNGSAGDGSGDDDRGAGGGSGYVISTASNRVLTQGGGSTSGNHGSVTIVSVNQ